MREDRAVGHQAGEGGAVEANPAGTRTRWGKTAVLSMADRENLPALLPTAHAAAAAQRERSRREPPCRARLGSACDKPPRQRQR